MQIIWQNRKNNIKLVYSFKGSRGVSFSRTRRYGSLCGPTSKSCGGLWPSVKFFLLLLKIVCIFFFFWFKTHFQFMYTFQSQSFSAHILSYFTLVNHKGSRWPVLFQFPCRHNIPTELVVGVGAPHSCVYYMVTLHQRTFPPSWHFLALLVG